MNRLSMALAFKSRTLTEIERGLKSAVKLRFQIKINLVQMHPAEV
jgi:hypothetical protein